MGGASLRPPVTRPASSEPCASSCCPPRSPKLNGCVERAQGTHTGEFYEVTDCALELGTLNQALRAWEHIYNTVRPHHALGYLTPQQFLLRLHALRKQAECH